MKKNGRISIRIASYSVTPKAVSRYFGLTLYPVLFEERRERVFCSEVESQEHMH